jgi:CheY-like chemotaxis protein
VPHTLLLADDSLTIQRVIELTFADEDVVVVAVNDGDQAVARLELTPPDIVLVDVGMSGRNGYEVARYIKQSPKLSHIPVVLLTGAFEPIDHARVAEAGCDGVLAKPFEPQLVISRVKELLANRQHVPASPEAPAMPSIPADDRPGLSVAGHLVPEPPAPAVAAPGVDDYFDRLDALFAGLAAPSTAPPEPMAPASPPEPSMPTGMDWFAPSTASSEPPAERRDVSARADTHAADQRSGSSLSAFDAVLRSTLTEPVVLNEQPAPIESVAIEQQPAVVETPVVAQQPAFVDSPRPDAPAETLMRSSEPEFLTPLPALSAADMAPSTTPPQAIRLREPVELPPIADAFASLLAAEQNEPLPATAATWPATAPSNDALVAQVTREVLAQLSERVVRDTVAELVSQIAERLIREEIEKIKGSMK